MWSSVPENDVSFKFKWYGATTEIANLTGTGAFTAASFTGNGIALTAINASNVTSGTLDNARTTGNTANSASTIVLRDASGSFGANVISASLFSGDGSGINAINASNISSGTIANARTTAASANGASTIVLRDSSGSFEANTVNASSLVGNGVAITAINASNISSGTIANARTTAISTSAPNTIVLRDADEKITVSILAANQVDATQATITGNFSANTVTCNTANISGNLTANTAIFTRVSGNGIALTAINASNISSGTIDNARTTGNTANSANTLVLRDANGNFASNEINGQEVIATNGLFVNSQTVSSSYSIPANSSAMSVGPITVANSVSVTVPSGGRWVIL